MNEDIYLKTINRMLTTVERVAAPAAVQGATFLRSTAGSALLDTALAAGKKGLLAGKKTYIVAFLGLVSTAATAGISYYNGELSNTGLLAAIGAAVVSSGVATLRSAIAANQGEQAAQIFDALQGVAAQIVEAQAAHATSAAVSATTAKLAADDATSAMMGVSDAAQTSVDAAAAVQAIGETVVADNAKLEVAADGSAVVVPQPKAEGIIASVVDHLPAWSAIKGVPKIGS